MDLNIRTRADVRREWERRDSPVFKGEDEDSIASVAGEDGYWMRLRKYVPAETIGAYLLIDGSLRQLFDKSTELLALRIGLAIMTVLLGSLTWKAATTIHRIVRPQQRAVSVVAFLVWVIGQGGVLSTFAFWEPLMGVIGVILFGVFVQVYQLPSLPS